MEHLVSIGNKFIFGTSGIGWNAFSNRMRKIHSFFCEWHATWNTNRWQKRETKPVLYSIKIQEEMQRNETIKPTYSNQFDFMHETLQFAKRKKLTHMLFQCRIHSVSHNNMMSTEHQIPLYVQNKWLNCVLSDIERVIVSCLALWIVLGIISLQKSKLNAWFFFCCAPSDR